MRIVSGECEVRTVERYEVGGRGKSVKKGEMTTQGVVWQCKESCRSKGSSQLTCVSS